MKNGPLRQKIAGFQDIFDTFEESDKNYLLLSSIWFKLIGQFE